MEKIDSTSSIEIYRSPEGNIELNVKLENDTVWLTQSQMAELFGRDRTVISRHIRNCFNEGELDKSLVCAKFAHPKKYGRREGRHGESSHQPNQQRQHIKKMMMMMPTENNQQEIW